MRRVFFSAATAVLLSLSAVVARADVVMTFQVNITSAPGLPDFSPISFLEVWSIAPDGTATVDDGGGLIAAMKTLEGVSATYAANVAFAIGQVRNFQDTPWIFDEHAMGGPFAFHQTLTTGALGEGDGEGLIGNDFAAFITAGRLLTFALTGPRPALLGEERTPGGFVSQVYFGTAMVVPNADAGAIPEPSSWALLILGLGGAGAALRARRRFDAV